MATPDYNIICIGGERSFLFNSQRLQFAVYNGRHCIITVRMLIHDVGPAEKIIARGGSMPLLSST